MLLGLAAALPVTGCGSEAQYRASERMRFAREAAVLVQRGDTEAALAVVDQALGLPVAVAVPPPSQVDLLLMKADLLGRHGRADEAWQQLERAHAFDPAHPEVVAARASRELERGDAPAAIAILEQAISRSPRNLAFRMQTALLLMGEHESERARALLTETGLLVDAVRRSDPALPDAAPVWLCLGVLDASEDPAHGVDDFLRAAREFDGRTLSVLEELANAGYDSTILRVAELAAQREPQQLQVGRTLALVRLFTGHTEEAVREVERLLALEPPPPPETEVALLMIAAQAAQMARDPAGAQRWIGRALDTDPSRLDLLEGYAMLVLRGGGDPAALADLKERVARATLAIEDPAALERLRALASQLDALDP